MARASDERPLHCTKTPRPQPLDDNTVALIDVVAELSHTSLAQDLARRLPLVPTTSKPIPANGSRTAVLPSDASTKDAFRLAQDLTRAATRPTTDTRPPAHDRLWC